MSIGKTWNSFLLRFKEFNQLEQLELVSCATSCHKDTWLKLNHIDNAYQAFPLEPIFNNSNIVCYLHAWR